MFAYRPKVWATRAYESDLFLLTDLSCHEKQSRRISSQFQSPVSWYYVFLKLPSMCRCLLVINPASSVSECTQVIAHSWVCLGQRWGFWTLQCCRPASACLWLLERGKAMLLAAYFGLCIFLYYVKQIICMMFGSVNGSWTSVDVNGTLLDELQRVKNVVKLWKGYACFFDVAFKNLSF